MLMEKIFRDVYRNNIWGDPETVSGHGSGVARTAAFRDQFANLLIELGTRSLLDAGCGDFNWMKEVQLPIERYFGVDVVPELIAKNQTNTKLPGDSSFIATLRKTTDNPIGLPCLEPYFSALSAKKTLAAHTGVKPH